MARHTEHSNAAPASLTHHPLIAELLDRLRVLACGQLVGTRRGPAPADAVQLLHLIGRAIVEAGEPGRPQLHPILEHAIADHLSACRARYEAERRARTGAPGTLGGTRPAVAAPTVLHAEALLAAECTVNDVAAGEGARHG